MQKRQIGIITNWAEGVFQRDVIAGVREVMVSHDYGVVVDSIAVPHEPRQAVSLDVNHLDGVVVIADVLRNGELQAILGAGCPVSLVSHQVPDLDVPSVISDNADGIRLLIEHLVETCQRQKFVFIQGVQNQKDAIERERQFRLEIMRRAITLDTVRFIRGDFEDDVVRDSMRALLAKTRDFDAVVSSDYLMAVAVIEELQAVGLRVPQDVCVVGFGDAPIAAEHGLTTVAADIREVGRRSARQLLGQMKGLRIRGETILGTDLIIRDTSC